MHCVYESVVFGCQTTFNEFLVAFVCRMSSFSSHWVTQSDSFNVQGSWYNQQRPRHHRVLWPLNSVVCVFQSAGVWVRVPGALGLADGHGRHGDGQPPADDVGGAEASSVQGKTGLFWLKRTAEVPLGLRCIWCFRNPTASRSWLLCIYLFFRSYWQDCIF